MMLDSRSKRIAFVLGAAAALGILAWQGHRIAHWLPQIEHAIAELEPWGPVIYLAAAILLSPLFVPKTIFGVVTGVVFGLGKGFAFYYAAVYAACLIAYFVSRRWLRDRVLAALEGRPELRRMALAESRESLRLTLWIRLVPINGVLASYALGAVGVPVRAFALGTLAILPHMFMTVYLGAAAAHVTRMAAGAHAHWTLEGAGLLLGLGACVVVVLQIASMAWRQIQAAGAEGGARPALARSADR